MGASLVDLPNELIQQIVLYLPPSCLPGFQRICRRFNALVDPLVWRQLCRYYYRYWRPEHRIQERFRAEVTLTDWKALFQQRQLVDRLTTETLNSILASQRGRIEKFREILTHGYDTKDCLLRHCRVGDDAEDVLARRYYSSAVLGCIHRTKAIEEWASVKSAEDVSIERAIGAFDAFVLQDRQGDFNEISARLDSVANDVRMRVSTLTAQSIRQQAVAVNRCLRAMRLVGVYDETEENHPRNHFLGIALRSEGHSSLTLVSTLIYCCVARRLGIDATPGVFPFQVLAVIRPGAGMNLDGEVTADEITKMYLNPSAADEEILVDDLVAQLVAIGAPRYSHEALLGASTTSELVLRAARNIYHSVHETSGIGHPRPVNGGRPYDSSEPPFPDFEGSLYSSLWALLLLGVPPDGDGPAIALRRRNYLPQIVEQFETNFPWDIALFEKYIVPLFQSTDEHVQLRESIRVMRSVDSMAKQVRHRSSSTSKQVKYRVGQVFLHKRYNYMAVITGWDVECAAHPHWMAQMRVHELSRGGQQSFYHVLVEDKSVRYVAEENIEPIRPEVPFSLMPLAGRHFKRWDKGVKRFVSNIVDEYPND